jgi:signal transduction histidine kinase
MNMDAVARFPPNANLRRSPSVRGWAVPAAAGFIALAAVAAAILLKPGSVTKAVDDFASPLFYLAAAICGLVAASRHRGRPRVAFSLLAACCFLLGVGDAIWAYDEIILRQVDPFPSAADTAYLASMPLAIAGITLLPGAPSRHAARVRAVLDGSLIAGSLLLLSWVTALGAVYRSSSGTTVDRAISLAYPVLDIIVVSLILFVVGRVFGPARRTMVLIGLGFLFTSTSDSVYAFLTATNSYRTGGVIDIGWMAGAYLIGLGLLTASRGTSTAELSWRPPGWLGSTLPYLAALFAFGLAGAQDYRSRLDWFGLLIAAAVIALVLVRQMLMLVENSRLLVQSQEANRLKSRFLAITSHELRTPLAVIAGYSDMLLQGVDGELTSSQAECVREIQRSGSGLIRIIDDLLDISKIEAGQMRLQVAPHDLSAIVSDLAAALHPLVLARGLELKVDEGDGIQVFCDPARARQVITNLVANAVNFTEAGSIVVSACVHEGVAEVAVEDTGVGISRGDLGHIFDEFRQGEGQRHSGGGAGLGLAISQKLVELQHGRIGVSSEPGAGSRFWFTLPLATPAPPERRRESAVSPSEAPAVR